MSSTMKIVFQTTTLTFCVSYIGHRSQSFYHFQDLVLTDLLSPQYMSLCNMAGKMKTFNLVLSIQLPF